MADVITRFKLETTQYDSKLRDAAKGLKDFTHQAQLGGKGFTDFSQKAVESARALGNTASGATNTKEKVRDLVGAFNEAARAYNSLSEAQQQHDFGKNLAASLETLKGRITEAKQELYSATQSLQSNGEAGQGTSGILEVLKDKFTVNIDALTLFNKGLQVAEVALNVAKDAFFASEATVDEWGRIVDSSKSLYEGFLTALNTGDISGYLGRIDEIVNAARTAYNELDRLGTMKTIQAPKMSAQQTENERMRMMIQTGRYIAPVDGRRASMKDGQMLTPEQIRRLETQLQNGMKSVVTLVGNEVRQTGKAIDAVYNRQAQELGMSLKEFRKGTSSMAEFDKRMAGYDQYQKWREQHTTIDMQSGREIVARGNPFEQFAKWGTFRVDGQRYNDLVRLIQQRDQQAGQAYSMQSQAYRTMNRAEGVTVSKLMRGGVTGGGGRSGGGGGGFDISSIAFNAPQVTPEQMIAPPSVWEEYSEGIRKTFETVGDGMDNLTEWTNNFDPYTDKMKKMTKAAKQQRMAFGMAGQAAENFGAALAGMDDPAARAAGTVISAIANIALGFGMAVAQASSMGPWAWLAYVAAGTAALATTISTVHQLTGYAEGGIVGGNSYSGDNIYGGGAMVNSGELVLNKAQQGNLASQLQGNGLQNMNISGRIKGTDIILSIDRSLKLEGKQLLTWG